jgi:hypothetical protein
LNIDKITYVTTKTWDITFVEPLFGNEGITGNNVMSVALTNDGALGIQLMNITNKTPYGFRMLLNGETSSGGRVGFVVYK